MAKFFVHLHPIMSGKEFRFKQFTVSHENSSMKVGVDGVLLGIWADLAGCRRILDAGCGCGVLALICAQRNQEAIVDAIDNHGPSAQEAAGNFARSPWAARLRAKEADFSLFRPSGGRYDLIISNPPYFDSGVSDTATVREQARHETTFGPLSLVGRAPELLAPGGRLAIIFPTDRLGDILGKAEAAGLSPLRICTVSGRAGKEPKRVLLELTSPELPAPAYSEGPVVCPARSVGVRREHLDIESSPGVYTPEYLALGRDFYLKF